MFPAAEARIAFLVLALTCLALPARAIAGRTDFEKEIKPIFETACVQCHGADKQKGKLRLDTREAWIKGGDSGPAFEPGDPAKSEVVRRITLPEDEDDVMPPKGKADHLTAAQVAVIKRWITEGAEWPTGVVAKAAPIGGKPPQSESERVGPPVSSEELRVIAELAKRGIKVAPIASGVNWRRADLRPLGTNVTANDFALLSRVSTLRELNLSGVAVRDEDIAAIASLPHLAVLHLANTGVTDAALAHLARAPKLASLNLFGTTVTDAGIGQLAALSGLKSLYVAGTHVTAAGVEKLRERLPKTEIEFGAEFAEISKPDPAPKPAPVKSTPSAPPATSKAPAPASTPASPKP
jgi:mono/diheme cytochrome c family protein